VIIPHWTAASGAGMSEHQRIKEFILKNFLFTDDMSALADDASLIGQGVIDSTGILEIIVFLEETFSIKISDEEMTPVHFDSIDAISAFVDSKRK
jgi:acyl carrier protein